MTQSVAGGPEFHLPDEILSVIPTDPYEQLDLAKKITSMAIASRVSKLESETGRLRRRVEEKDQVIADLKDRIAELENEFEDADGRLRDTLEDNAKLSKERDTLSLTVKKLARDLAKMENFKRHLMQTLKEDSASQEEALDIQAYDQSFSRVSSWKGCSASNMLKESTEMLSTEDASRSVRLRSSITPHMTQRFTPNSTPKLTSAAVSPKMASGATSPTKPLSEGDSSLSAWQLPSEQSSAANSPPHGRNLPGRTRIDGKEFFRQARNRLSYEQFGAFLLNIKELNAHRQSRQDTLRRAEEIFGKENKDLYLSFQGLLNRSLH